MSEVEVYSDSARTVLVLPGRPGAHRQPQGEAGGQERQRPVRIGDGVGFSADNTDVSVALFPKLLLWRLRNLRGLAAPGLSDRRVFCRHLPAADRRPIVDPDVIGPDDFRRPDPGQLFALWRTRRLWIDQRLQDLVSLTKTVPVGTQTFTVPDLDKVFARMYAACVRRHVDDALAHGHTSVAVRRALGETLERGATADVSTATARLVKDLNLSVDAFVQVVRIRAKQRQWESDPEERDGAAGRMERSVLDPCTGAEGAFLPIRILMAPGRGGDSPGSGRLLAVTASAARATGHQSRSVGHPLSTRMRPS